MTTESSTKEYSMLYVIPQKTINSMLQLVAVYQQHLCRNHDVSPDIYAKQAHYETRFAIFAVCGVWKVRDLSCRHGS